MSTMVQHFEQVLSREPFKGLKAILDSLGSNRDALCEAVSVASSLDDLLVRLGYRIASTRQIHVQDAFSHLGPAGGIRVVLPYYDIPTHSSFPTLVNFDLTFTTTPKSADFFGKMLASFKAELSA